MKRYNSDTDRMERLPKTLEVDGINRLTSKMTEVELIEQGHHPISYGSRPNRRYYTAVENKALVNDIYEVTYIAEDLLVADVQAKMIKDLAIRATEKEESGITVIGMEIATDAKSQAKLTAGVTFFGRNPNQTRRFKHKNGFADATETSMIEIQDALATHIEKVTQNEESIYIAIKALGSIEECILYERTPYDYPLTGDDELAGLGTEGDVIERYKNNVKEW